MYRLTLIQVFCLLLALIFNVSLASTTLDIHVQGLTGDAKKNVLAQLNLIKQSTTLTPDLIKHWHTENNQHIQQALQPFAYYRPIIHSQLTNDNAHWVATYRIEPGTALTLSRVQLTLTGEGQHETTLKRLLATFPLHVGSPLLTSSYEQRKQELLNQASALGYLDAKFLQHAVNVNLEQYTASIDLHLDTGKRYYFGPIKFSASTFADDFLQRFVPFQTQTPYTSRKLLQLQDQLSQSRYFQQVAVHGDKLRANEAAQIPIYVKLTPRKPHLYNIGLGIGTDTGARTSFGWNWRRTNPYGHYLTSVISASHIQRGVVARYVIPGKNPLTDQYNIIAGANRLHIKKGESTTYQLGTNYRTQFNRWQQTLGVTYQREESRLQEEDPILARYILSSAAWEMRTGNHRFFATQGYSIRFSIRGAFKALLSDTNFVQTELQGKYIVPTSKVNQLVLRAQGGYTTGNDLNVLPISMRFFTGGTKSIRGFSYQDIGPGRFLGIASAEFQQRVIANWYATTFYDAGNAFNDFPMKTNRAAGIGAIWVSPVGPIELTWARAINLPHHPAKIQFSMGVNL